MWRHCVWWGTKPKLNQSPTNNNAQSHMATSMIPPGSLATSSPCIHGTNPLCALWVYLLGFVNMMVRIGIDKPPWTNLRWSGACYLPYMKVQSNLVNTTPSILGHIFARPNFLVQTPSFIQLWHSIRWHLKNLCFVILKR